MVARSGWFRQARRAGWRSGCARPLVCEALEPRSLLSFLAPVSVDTGSSPAAVAVADFNGDGIPDLAVANYNSASVSVLLGNGDGSFQPARNSPSGGNPRAMAVADFNGDGILDLVVTNYNRSMVSVLLGQGDGTFRYFGGFAVRSFPIGVAVGDFNGDGLIDLAVADGSGASVLLGQGDGSFQDARAFPAGHSPASVAVGDFNGDGVLDLAVANQGDGTVSVLLGQGDGTFQSARTVTVGTHPVAVAVADLNGDGIPDLAVANQGNFPEVGESVGVLLGRGDGTFQPAQNFAAGSNPSAVVVADFNGDGIPDLAVANAAYYQGPSTASVLLGNGDGTFQAPWNVAVGAQPQALAAEDFNNDGIPDLAVANYNSDNVSVLLGQRDGIFPATPSFPAGTNPTSEVVGDFNNDGIPDLAVANVLGASSSNVSVLLGRGDGTLGAAQSFSVGSFATVAAVGDFNGDGNLDLIEYDLGTGGSGGGLHLLLGNGDGTFQPARTIMSGGFFAVAVADFNGDGIPDIAVAPILGSTVTIDLGVGDGTFQTAGPFAIGDRPGRLAVGDFNGDGIPDLVALDAGSHGVDPSVTVLLGTGGGNFGSPQSFQPLLDQVSVAVGDFNGDGLDDLAVTGADRAGHPGVEILLALGDGSFGIAGDIIPIGPRLGQVAVADFNNDGVPDLAVTYQGHVRVLLGAGDGTFQQPFLSYITGTTTSPLVVADFNGDGLPDLAATDARSDAAAVLLNDGNWPVGLGGSSRPGARGRRVSRAAQDDAALALAGVVRALPDIPRHVGPGPVVASPEIPPRLPLALSPGGATLASVQSSPIRSPAARLPGANAHAWPVEDLAVEPGLPDAGLVL